MTLLESLTIVRGVAALSPQIAGRQGQAALKVVDRKIRSLQRKKAWRDCPPGQVPAHELDKGHPLNIDVKWDHNQTQDFPPIVPMWSADDCAKALHK